MAGLTPNDLSHMSDAESRVLCPQGEHAPGPEPLSPTAQAVLDAYKGASDGCYIDGEWIQDHAGQLAAALRAAVDQAVPESGKFLSPGTAGEIRAELLAIAAELLAQ